MIKLIEIFSGMIGFLTILAFVIYVVFKSCQVLFFTQDDEVQEEDLDEFFDRFYREQEEINKRWEERMIEKNRIKHRINKLKAPKPK